MSVVCATTRTRPRGCSRAMSCRQAAARATAAPGSSPPGRWPATGSAWKASSARELLAHLGQGQALGAAEVQLAQSLVDARLEPGGGRGGRGRFGARLSGEHQIGLQLGACRPLGRAVPPARDRVA